MKRASLFPFAAIIALIALPALGQFPAENQVGQVDNRVGGELYGNNTSSFTIRPYQVRLLPSEERNAIVRSGMLPSEFTLNRAGVGPLSPNGILDYITPRSPLQQAMRLPAPQLYNPAYDLTLNPYHQNVEESKVRAGFELSAAEKARDKRQGSLPPLMSAPAQPLPNGQLPTGQLSSGQLSNLPESLPQAHSVTHTVRHGTLLIKRPSTQATPPPEPKP